MKGVTMIVPLSQACSLHCVSRLRLPATLYRVLTLKQGDRPELSLTLSLLRWAGPLLLCSEWWCVH